MGELSIEEKAKAYDEAIERARKINSGEGVAAPPDWTTCEVIFPGLKEREDERIRKEIISFIQDDIDDINLKVSGDYDDRDADDIAHQNWCKKALAWLEKQGSQNLANSAKTCKVEPKFKVGDWVVVGDKTLCRIEKVTELPYDHYQYWTTDGHWFGDGTESHIWTIQDAKDGDVLATQDSVFIFKHMDKTGLSLCKSYCEIIGNSELGFGFEFSINGVYPATKKQRDLLFQEMKETGYEWDAEKKELKKIGQEQDVTLQINPSEYINDMGGNGCYLKNNIQASAWSEEDEDNLYHINALIKDSSLEVRRQEYLSEWLKSLKERELPIKRAHTLKDVRY